MKERVDFGPADRWKSGEGYDFVARAAGTQLKCFGIGESGGGYTLAATDLGG